MQELRRNLHILLIAYRNYSVYLYDLLGKNIIFLLRILIIITMYKALYNYGISKNVEYTLEQVSWGLIFVQSIVTSRTRVSEEVAQEVKSWRISNYLLNPISYIWFKFIVNITEFAYNIAINLSIWIIFGWLYLWSINTSIYGILWWFLLVIWSMLLQYFAYFIIGLSSFYMEDNEWVRMIYNFLDRVFGWNIMPIPFFPVFIQKIIYLSPFAYTGYTAGLIFSRFDLNKFIYYSAVQFAWIIIYIVVMNLLYNNAKKHLVINWW